MSKEYTYTVENTYDPSSCPFCDPGVVDTQQVYESQLFRLFYCLTPAVDGNLLLVPKRHLYRFEELNSEEMVDFHSIMQWIPSLFQTVYGADHYFILQKNGESAGQSVAHIHFHLVPVHSKDQSAIERVFNYRSPISSDEMRNQVQKLRTVGPSIWRRRTSPRFL